MTKIPCSTIPSTYDTNEQTKPYVKSLTFISRSIGDGGWMGGGATGICVVRWWGVRGEDKREALYDSSCTAHSTSQKCCTPPTNPNPNPKRNDTYTDIGEIREERYQTNCYQTRCFTDLYVTNYSFCITTSTCDLHMGHFFSRRTSVVDPEPSTGFVKERG